LEMSKDIFGQSSGLNHLPPARLRHKTGHIHFICIINPNFFAMATACVRRSTPNLL
jgi:hypothetical protein